LANAGISGVCRINCAWLEAGSLKSNLATVALFVPDVNYTVRSPLMVAASQPQPPFGQTSDSGRNDHHHGKILQAANRVSAHYFA